MAVLTSVFEGSPFFITASQAKQAAAKPPLGTGAAAATGAAAPTHDEAAKVLEEATARLAVSGQPS